LLYKQMGRYLNLISRGILTIEEQLKKFSNSSKGERGTGTLKARG